jgi:transposase
MEHGGEHTLWRVVRVPTVAQEDARRLHRELERRKKERTVHQARVSSLQTRYGVPGKLTQRWLRQPVEQWPGLALPAALVTELARDWQRLLLVDEQIAALTKQQAEKLTRLRVVGPVGAWLLAHKLFGGAVAASSARLTARSAWC